VVLHVASDDPSTEGYHCREGECSVLELVHNLGDSCGRRLSCVVNLTIVNSDAIIFPPREGVSRA